MYRIGLLSDTHGFLDKRFFELFKDCDEVWHAGDIGDIMVADELEKFKPLRAVYGNIDGNDVRIRYPKEIRITVEGMEIWMTHIGGYPGNYDRSLRERITSNPPGLFIAGHSHILKVINDKKLGLLHMNPGAAGRHGLHHVRTAIRFSINESKVADLEVIELGSRSAL